MNQVPTGWAYNSHARKYTFEKFKKEYFGDRHVPNRIAREFWDDFQACHQGSVESYKAETGRNL